MIKRLGLMITALLTALPAFASTYMDVAWANQACATWNASPILTEQLMETIEDEEGESGYSWIKNNAGRGYKLVQMYRTSCGVSTKVQLTIQEKNGKALCTRAGKSDGKVIDFSVDYVMHASDENWTCMGRGSFGCGAMGAMMSGKLKFQGPKFEVMKVMNPFKRFLKIVGKTAGDKSRCP
ncbi:MAG: SCP2 sterol-binding domain-containing protein [Thiotrichaceae bacterium]|nr:SCP2 sterol-binding domain-containing protein [Thiotrichaceae bacterium]